MAMKIRAYRAIERRLTECSTRKLRTEAQREAFATFTRRIQGAVAADPEESQPIEVPWDEWDAYTVALDDRSGG